jgi:glutaredoxin-like protein
VHDPLEQTADHPEVTVFWRPGCGFCALLERGLSKAGLEYQRRNIWEDAEAAQFVRLVNGGNETVPTVSIGTDVYTNPPYRLVLEKLGIDPPEGPFTRLLKR